MLEACRPYAADMGILCFVEVVNSPFDPILLRTRGPFFGPPARFSTGAEGNSVRSGEGMSETNCIAKKAGSQ